MSIAPSTCQVYTVGFKHFHTFCSRFNLRPMPSSPKTIRFFCADMIDKVSFHTLKLYLAGIRFLLVTPTQLKATLFTTFVGG